MGHIPVFFRANLCIHEKEILIFFLCICTVDADVHIQPVLDMCALASVSTISFLSGCTVLSMSCYSVGKNILSGENRVQFRTGTPLALGAVIGGIAGKQLFELIKGLFENQNAVGAVQAGCLALVTLGTFLYTLFKSRIRSHNVQNPVLCVLIGGVLGLMSSFLGIGGGPINLAVLFFFFGMDTKTAAQNSLYIILFSQIANLLTTLIGGNVPEFQPIALVFMVGGGIGGGIVGHCLNKKMNNKAVDKLFLVLMAIIIGISLWNTWKYAQVM